MALANFFGKNALAASQVLGGMTADTLAGILDEHVVAIALDEAAALSPEGRVTAALAMNLAARLYPRVAVLRLGPTGAASEELTRALADAARAINPDIELMATPDRVTVAVVLGKHALPARGATPSGSGVTVVYAGSRAWDALISPEAPVASGGSRNPFGAAAAACLALANVFRVVFRAHLSAAEVDRAFALSLFDYRQTTSPRAGVPALGNGPALEDFDLVLGETILGGIGAIGNATVWTLAHVERLTGRLLLVDDQSVGLSNLQRYVLTTQAQVTVPTQKVTLAADVLRAAARARGEQTLEVVPHPLRWGAFLRQRGDFRLARVATAFDTIDARLAVQAALPARLFNAWTQQGDLGVSRHLAFGQAPCLACLYRPRAGGKSEAELVGDAMGMPGAPLGIRELLYSSVPIGEAFVRDVAARRGIIAPESLDVLLRYASMSLREFYQEAFCGGVILQLGGSADGTTVRAEVPMAFQSVLAGVMLAAELVIDAGRLRDSNRDTPAVRTVIDLLRPLAPYLQPPVGRRTDGLCLCEDPDYLSAYAGKYDQLVPTTTAGSSPNEGAA